MKLLLCIVMAALLMITTTAYAVSSGQQEQALAGGTAEESLYRMAPVFDSFARNMGIEGEVAYDANSPQFFWTQLYILGSNWSHANALARYEQGEIILPASVMQEYAAASFYEFKSLPDIPKSVTAIRFEAASSTYRLNLPGMPKTFIIVERYATDADNALLVGIGFYDSYESENPNRLGGLLIQIADNPYQGTSSDPAFPYSVKNVQPESEEDFKGLTVTNCRIQHLNEVLQPASTPKPTVTPAPDPIVRPTVTMEPSATPTPAPSEYPKLSLGSRGESVRSLQSRLNELGYRSGSIDGVFGSNTKRAVRYFQDAIGANQDGVATIELQQRLYAADAPEFVLYVQLKKGSSGVRVEKLQTRLRELGYLAMPMDGKFGNHTMDAVKLFQKKANLKIDGIAGVQTHKALFKKNAPRCDVYIALKRGDTGIRVKEMKDRLHKLGFLSKKYNSTYNNDTVKALEAFLKALGEKGNGKTADPKLLEKLFKYVPPTPSPKPTPTPAPAQAITVEQLNTFTAELNTILGTHHNAADAVKWLQQKLGITENSVYDSVTKTAVSAYQTNHGLSSTGIADTETINKLL